MDSSETRMDASKLIKKNYLYPLLKNVHLANRPQKTGPSYLVQGEFEYFHYGCDGFNDNGWGCAYRTIQSICSHILHKQGDQDKLHIPSLNEIQRILVESGDKSEEFIGSHDWIGAVEVFCVIHSLYDISSKIIHVSRKEEIKTYANEFQKHFEKFGTLIMMGGDLDTGSKGIAGVQITDNDVYFLIVDPHYVGKPKNAQELVEKGYVRWQHTTEFVDSSFYNFCLPQIKWSD